MTERVCVAQIGAAHGIRGEVKLWSFTTDPLAIREYGPLETEDGAARFKIASLRAAIKRADRQEVNARLTEASNWAAKL